MCKCQAICFPERRGRSPFKPYSLRPHGPLACARILSNRIRGRVDTRVWLRRAWLLLGWVTAERSFPCKQPACPAIGGGSEVTFKSLTPRLSTIRSLSEIALYSRPKCALTQGRDVSLMKLEAGTTIELNNTEVHSSNGSLHKLCQSNQLPPWLHTKSKAEPFQNTLKHLLVLSAFYADEEFSHNRCDSQVVPASDLQRPSKEIAQVVEKGHTIKPGISTISAANITIPLVTTFSDSAAPLVCYAPDTIKPTSQQTSYVTHSRSSLFVPARFPRRVLRRRALSVCCYFDT
ncbi:hypothetical protein J6590_025092 [Homalodisca vitripennis]|nr:hypothetical protein J6590_025092 [Homalodisca vitripennis]